MSLLWIEMRSLACPYCESEVQVQCNASSEELDEIVSSTEFAVHSLTFLYTYIQ